MGATDDAFAAPTGIASAAGSTVNAPTWDRPVTSAEPSGAIPPVAVSSSANAVRYQAFPVTAPTDGVYNLGVTSDATYSLAPVICVYSGHFDASSPLANVMVCENSGGTNSATTALELVPGTTYYAVVTGQTNADRGDFTITVDGPDTPTILTRTVRRGSVPATGSTVVRPVDGSAPLTASTNSDQYVFSGLGVTVAGTYSFDVGGSFDAFACLYNSTFDANDPETNGIVCADLGGSTPRAAYLSANLTPGNRYVLMVTGNAAGQNGSWSANIDGPGAVFGAQMQGDLTGKQTWIRPIASTPPTAGTFRAPYEARPFAVDVTGTYSAYLGLGDQFLCLYNSPFSASDPTANVIACDDDSGDNGRASRVTTTLNAGTPYVLVASSFNSNSGVGPWVAEIYGAGTSVGLPDTPSVTRAQLDGAGNVVVTFRGADTGGRPSAYSASLSPYLGTPAPAVTGPSPLAVPLPNGWTPGAPLSLIYRAVTGAGTSAAAELDPPTAVTSVAVTQTPTFAARVDFTPAPQVLPDDDVYATVTSTDPQAATSTVHAAAGAGSITLPGLTPSTRYTVSVVHANALGAATTTATTDTPAATTSVVSTVSPPSPTFERPLPGSTPPFTGSGQLVPFQTTYFHVSRAGTYAFLASTHGTWDSAMTLVTSPFDPASPLTSTLASRDGLDGSDQAAGTQVLSSTLQPGDYAIVMSGQDGSQSGTATISVRSTSAVAPTFGTPGVPSVPAVTGVSDDGAGSIVVQIQPPLDSEGTITGYTAILRDGSATTTVPLDSGTTQSIKGLVDGHKYWISVIAVNSTGPSPESAQVLYTLPAPPAPAKAPTVGAITNTSATVSFTVPADNGLPITGFDALVEPGDLHFAGSPDGSPIPLTQLTPGMTYTVAVAASNARGAGAYSPATTFTTATVPGAPTVGQVTPGVHSATMVVTAPAAHGSPIVTYAITLTPTGGADAPIVTKSQTKAGNVSVTGLVSGVTYQIGVSAANAYGYGPDGDGGTVVPTSQPPSAPTLRNFTDVDYRSAVAHWTTPTSRGTDPITGYVLTLQPGNLTFTTVAPATSMSLAGLAPATTYTGTIAARSVAGTSVASAAVSFTTAALHTATLVAAAPASAAYGSTVTVSATLRDSTASAAIGSAAVSLYRRADSTQPWTVFRNTTTDSTGVATASFVASANGEYYWAYAGGDGIQPATSSVSAISVAPVVSVTATSSSIRVGQAVVLYGTVKPSAADDIVSLQYHNSSGWHDRGVTAAIKRQRLPDGTTTTGYVLSYTPTAKGAYQFRVTTAAGATLLAGASPGVSVSVIPLDTSSITRGAASTAPYNTPFTLSATLQDVTTSTVISGARLTLYQRPDSSAAWTVARNVTTDANGIGSTDLTLTAPAQFYWSYAGSTSVAASISALIPVRIVQGITASVTASTVPVAQSLSVYGKVSPAGSGETVRLQKLSARGAWQDAGVTATIRRQAMPDGTTIVGFLLSYTPTSAGTLSLRIVKDATDTYGAGQSATMTVSVTS